MTTNTIQPVGMSTQKVTDEALGAFWQIIVLHYPQATSGDLSPERSVKLQLAAQAAVGEWIENNVPIPTGYRFALNQDVDRFPDFIARQGMTGTVKLVDDHGIWARMDQHIAGCEQWDNELHWERRAEFFADTKPL